MLVFGILQSVYDQDFDRVYSDADIFVITDNGSSVDSDVSLVFTVSIRLGRGR